MRIFATKKRQNGAATSIDIMLTFPIFATLLLFMIQMALVLHAYTVIHYSAYKAARSARVHVLNSDHAFLDLDFADLGLPNITNTIANLPNALILVEGLVGGTEVTDLINSEINERVTAAAMNQLISISPASEYYAVGGQGNTWHEPSVRAYVSAAAGLYGDAARTEPIIRKARYAYSDINTNVDFRFLDFQNPVLQEIEDVWRIYDTVTNTPVHSQINVPVTVTVRYRYELQIPIGQWFFANDPTRSYGRWMEATVKLM